MPDTEKTIGKITIEAKVYKDENTLKAMKLPKATANKAYISYEAFAWNVRSLNGFGFRRTDNNIAVYETLENTALNLGHKQNQVVGSNLKPVDDGEKVEGVSVVYKRRMEDYSKDIEDIDAVSIEADFFKEDAIFEWDGKDYTYLEAQDLGLVDAVEFFGGTGYVDGKQVTMWTEMREMVGLALVLTEPAFPSATIDQIAAQKVGGDTLSLVAQLKAATIGQSQYYEVLNKALRDNSSVWAMLGGKDEHDWLYCVDHTADKVIVRAKGSYWQFDYSLGEENVDFSNPIEMVAAYVPKTEMIQKEGDKVLAENQVTFDIEEYNSKLEEAKAEALAAFKENEMPKIVEAAVSTAIAELNAKREAEAAALKALSEVMPITEDERETIEASVRAEGFDLEVAKKDRMIAKLQKELEASKNPSTATATVVEGAVPTVVTESGDSINPFG